MQTISLGQALLILIKEFENSPKDLDNLKKLYLCGVDASNKPLLEKYLTHSVLQKFTISTNASVVNEDPTRRYFESHLAFATLKNSLANLNPEILKSFLTFLQKTLEKEKGENYFFIDKLLKGTKKDLVWFTHANDKQLVAKTVYDTKKQEIPPTIKLQILLDLRTLINLELSHHIEYLEAILKLEKETKLESKQETEIINGRLLLQINFLAVKVAEAVRNIPLEIYGLGIFSENSRGKNIKETQQKVISQHLGLMKSYMPVPTNDITYSETKPAQTRPAEYSNPNFKSEWNVLNFKLDVHPYSNSISGTMLCLLRTLKHADNKQQKLFTNLAELILFLKNSIAILLYYSGGHSLNEFFYVLKISEVQKSFSFEGFKDLTLSSLFYENNQAAFDSALKETLAYNELLLKKQAINQDINRPAQIFYNYLKQVKEKINAYAGKNKTTLIAEFNLEIERLALLPIINSLNINLKLAELRKILANLEQKEKNYYKKLWLFSNSRKSKSSLQTKINEAQDIMKHVKPCTTKHPEEKKSNLRKK